jgi:beta-glucosidase
MLRVLACAGVVAAAATAAAPTHATTPTTHLPRYKDSSLPVPDRVADLLPRMTVDELVAQVAHRYDGLSVAKVEAEYASTSIGQVSMQSLLQSTTALASLQARNALQSFFLNSSRLQIPVSIAQEGLHSGSAFGTVFPMPLLTACAWNDSLASAIGAVLAYEARGWGVDNTWSPVVNLFSDDRFGRYQEGFTPDPTLTSHLGRALVLGAQGGVSGQDDYLPGGFANSTWSTAKHFAGYGSPVGGLNGSPFVLNNRTLFEVFLRPWRSMAAVGLRGAMPSHQTVLDLPMHANCYLIQDVLRGEFGAGNISLVSDCDDIGVLSFAGITGGNQTLATAFGVRAGVDLDLQCGMAPSQMSYYEWIPDAIASGLITLADLQALVTHILTQKFASGLFDQPLTPEAWLDRLDAPPHRQLAYETAAQSIVLLQNVNDTLPLKLAASGGPVKTVALIGPQLLCSISADTDSAAWFKEHGTSYGPLAPGAGAASCFARNNMLGSYTLDAGVVSVPLLPDAFNATFPPSSGVSFTVSAGCSIDGDPRLDLIPAAVAAAAAADVAVVVVGDSLASCGEWIDRDDLDLPGGQMQLLEALATQTTTPIVLVLINGRAATFGPGNALLSRVGAVVEAWRPGEEGAQAIVDILSGAVNPSGKLTNSWAQNVGQMGSGAQPWLARRVGKWIANNRSASDPTDGREYDPYVQSLAPTSAPLFRFGHGLSYTSYAYKSIEVDVITHPRDMKGGAGTFSGRGRAGYLDALDTVVLNVTVSVCNTGARDGTEVVQVYSQDPQGVSALGLVPFWKRLVGYARLPLAAGACGAVTIPVIADDLAQYDDSMVLRVIGGGYIISAGGRSDQDTLQQKVDLVGETGARWWWLEGRE